VVLNIVSFFHQLLVISTRENTHATSRKHVSSLGSILSSEMGSLRDVYDLLHVFLEI
jgi:hypothetical protein